MTPTNLSDAKQFGIEVLDLIDELVKPDIKFSFIEKFWHFFTGYAKNKILNKPDNEIIEKLLSIQKKLNNKFDRLEQSVEINRAEKLGAVKIPMVGELAKTKNLTLTSEKQAEQLERELF